VWGYMRISFLLLKVHKIESQQKVVRSSGRKNTLRVKKTSRKVQYLETSKPYN
jgi:hypothetical protein